MNAPPDDPTNECPAEYAPPEPVKEGAGWTSRLIDIASNVAIVGVAGIVVYSLASAVMTSTSGAPTSARLQWEERQQEMLQTICENEAQPADEAKRDAE